MADPLISPDDAMLVPTADAASKTFAYNVLRELGVYNGLTGIWNLATIDTPEEFRAALKDYKPEEVINAIAKAEPAAAPFLESIKANPALAEKFHHRIVNEPDFLTGISSLTSGSTGNIKLEDLLKKPYGPGIIESMNSHIAKFINDESYTAAQLKSAMTSSVLEAMTNYVQGLDPSKRFEFMKTELSAFDPKIKDLFESLDAAPAEVKTAVGNAIAHNPGFTQYLIEKFQNGDGNTGLAGIFKNMDADRAGAIADIMNTIAQSEGYDFKKLDRVLTAAEEQAKLLDQIAALRKANPNADTSALDEQLSVASAELLNAAKDAGANIPALAMLNEQNMAQFFKDLFNPNVADPAKFALGNLAQALQLSGAELAAFNQLMGPLAEIMNFMFKPYAELYQNHGTAASSGLTSVLGNAETIFARTPVRFEAPVPVGSTVGEATTMTSDAFNKAWDDATAKTFDAVSKELLEVDPKLVEELKAIRENPTLRGKFEHAVTSTATPQELEAAARAFQAQIASGATLDTAIGKMAPGGS